MSRILTCLLIASAACDANIGSPIDTSGQIDSYIRSLPYLPADPAVVQQGQRSAPARDGDYQCTTQNLKETRQYDKIVAYAANSDSLWPGAIVGGQSVYSGLFNQIVLPRKPERISVSLENLQGAKSAVLDDPSLASFREAVSGIVAQNVDGATPANIYSEIEEVHSDKQLALAMGADVSWLGGAASIAASFNWSQTDTRSRYLVRYTQTYYTVDVDAPGSPTDFLDPSVQLDDVKHVIDEQNPPLYVASVTYGRMVVFTFESQYSAQELGAALDFAYSGGVDVSGQISVTYKDIISSSKITAFILGGSGGVAAQSITSYEDLMNFIKQGGNYSKDSPGAPIAYKLAYLKDNSPGRISLTTDYDVKDCERVSQKVKVTLQSIRVEDAGGDPGDDLEIYGTIWADGADRQIMFNRGSDSYVTVSSGTQFPQSSALGDAVLEVTPQPGGQIILGAHLWDEDLIGDDDLGSQVVVAPFELGWRRDVDVYLTGQGRVVATFSLQPI
ncbi:MAG TPA: thiol-activated cytolysin family protein [Kofleriaceae bacterium]|jgi:thiol-activated cytolysin|nr:thiol-activated cytolysin family protein [Kofleriaceae bacterium]